MNIPCLKKLYHYEGEQAPWSFAERDVDFSLEPRYETPLHVKYDASFAPYWKEPIEALIDFDVREVVILKPSRAGCTENVALNLMRYHAAMDPIPMFYLGGQQEAVERFFEERIVLGMKCSATARQGMDEWRVVGTRLIGDAWQITASYPGSKSADKQFGYQLVLIDEASLCPPGTVDTLRKRLDTYRYGHMLILSSPDAKQKKPSDEDAIFIEFENGDKREWFSPDPKTGKYFQWHLGDEQSVDGVKWDAKARGDDGCWNLSRVAETAHYVTPDGTEISNDERMKIVRLGKWIPTNTKPFDARKRSYHLDALCLPFVNGDFGHYAVEWLKAVAKGQEAVRVFKYEFQAEKFYGQRLVLEDDVTLQRQGKYKKGSRASDSPEYATLFGTPRKLTLCTVDVQKDDMYWLVREWMDGGNSALVDWGVATSWDGIAEQVVKHSCRKTFIDNSYKERRNEVFEQCLFGVMRKSVPCFGRDTLHLPYEVKARDPFEGTAKGGRHKIAMITHNPDQIKHQLYKELNGIGGHVWMIYEGIESKYVQAMASEQCIDGHWERKNKYNHPWDCEVLQVVGAMVLGVYRQVEIPDLAPSATPKMPADPTEEKPKPVKRPETGGVTCPQCGGVDIQRASKTQWQCMSAKKTGGRCLYVWTPDGPKTRWGDDDR